jgi:hypothetical protein
MRGLVLRGAMGLALLAAGLSAQEFPLFGARSLGMGRSGVASVADLSAVHVNPAALARLGGHRLAAPLIGGGFFSPDDIKETRDIIDEIVSADLTSPTAPQFVVDRINRLREDPVLGGSAQAMVAFAWPSGLTVSYTERATLDVLVSVDRVNVSTNPASPNFVGNNQSRGSGDLLWLREAGISWATALPVLDESILVGATGLVGHATSYFVDDTLYNLGQGGDIDWLDRIRDNRETSVYGDLVAGVQVALFQDRLVLGLTGNHLLRPAIDRAGNGRFHLDPQVRLGVAFSPGAGDPAPSGSRAAPTGAGAESGSESGPGAAEPVGSGRWTFTFDVDLTRNESILRGGIDSRHIGGGLEYAPRPGLALRAGIYANLEERDLGPTLTLGGRFHALELGLGYSTRNADSIANEVRAELALGFDF